MQWQELSSCALDTGGKWGGERSLIFSRTYMKDMVELGLEPRQFGTAT